MICVPYIVNNNYKVAQLSATQSPKPCYIIEKELGNSEVQLFSFDRVQMAFDPSQGYGTKGENDYIFVAESAGSSVTIDAANNTANIILALRMLPIRRDNKGKILKPIQKFAPIDGLSIKDRFVCYDFRAITQKPNDILVINIRLFEPKQNLYYDFSVDVAPRDNTYDIVIDFGSEASQIWINRRCNDPSNEGTMMSLVTSIKRNSSFNAEKDENIYQFDPSNPKLFRSLFFVKNEIPRADIQQNDLTFINRDNDLITIFAENVALPNMKLMDHSNVPLPEFYVNDEPLNIYQRVNEIRAEILKFFFKTALRQIDRTSNQPVACKITFLVPNTYKQETLSSVHAQLIEDLRLLHENAESPFEHIKGDIEVSTFSESDASFFGWYRAGEYSKSDAQKRVLIVDIGKGTTDFSVLRISSNQGQVTVERMARSGFVGAGNVMTFALLASVIRQIAHEIGDTNPADIYTAIRDMAYNSDRAKKNKLYHKLERLKCAPHITGRTTVAEFIDSYDFTGLVSISGLTIDKLSDILAEANEKECFQQDNDPVVNCYAKQITDRLITELCYVYDEDVDVDKVVLSGRGAMSNPLANAIKEAFRQINGKIEITQLPPSMTKSGCLKGPLNQSLNLDHMNMNIVGWPQQKRNLAMRSTPKHSSQPQTNIAKEEKKGFFEKIKGILSADEQVELGKEATVSGGFTQDDIAREFLRDLNPEVQTMKWEKAQGTEYTLEADTNVFVIGNRRCTANLSGAHSKLGKKNMYFDGNDFVLRDANTSVRFIYDPVSDNEAFLTETFFPMTELNGAVVVNMPQLNEVLRSCDGEEDGDEFGDEDTQQNTIHTTATAASTTTTAKTVPLTATTTKPSDDDDDFAADDDD